MLLRRIARCCTLPLLFAVAVPACAAGSGSDERSATAAPAAAASPSSIPATAVSTDAVTTGGEPPSVPGLVVDDVKHVVTSPARWDKDDWKTAGWSAAAVLGTALVIDHRWRDEMRRHAPNNNPLITQVERLGDQYSPAVVGGFLAVGALSSDDNTLETGEDMLSASLIASGIVTPVIKLVFGRARPRNNMGVDYFRPFSNLNASFPSGHTTEAFALASVIAGHYSPWAGYTAYGLAAMVGLARTYHDAHFASDVLAGAMIGTAVGRAVVRYNDEWRGHSKVVLVPRLAPGMVGVQVAGEF
ncbi:MAG TPA: phosphatase PAP2 family protein [Gallionellaceae bacterium]|nr:phosphatase PAP2 family protein [Gallionellaceae bacterium]